MQLAIDSAKRKFALDIPLEIQYIKSQLEISKNGLPAFWEITKRDKRKKRSLEKSLREQRENKEKIRKRINTKLVCPMNYMYNLKLAKYKSPVATIPISKFLAPCEIKETRCKNEKVLKLIEKYAIDLQDFEIKQKLNDDIWYEDEYPVIMNQFDELVKDIRKIGIPQNYKGLTYWLINRAFRIPEQTKNCKDILKNNKPMLLKVLYEVNPTAFLECFLQQVSK